MSRCSKCIFAVYEQYKGHRGRWLCFHPHRAELSDRGEFIKSAVKPLALAMGI